MASRSILDEDVLAGQAVYSRLMLAVYDPLVLGLSCRLVWRCPSDELLKLYRLLASNNHLDAGVGTGYFLDRCRFSSLRPRIAILDLNANSLHFASRRLARYQPDVYRANLLEPIRIDAPLFDSIALSAVLHCLPGSIRSKGIVFDHLKALLNPDGVLFGGTLLTGGVRPNWLARRLTKVYNAARIFSNLQDDAEGLEEQLASRFSRYSMHVVGCLALFWGRP